MLFQWKELDLIFAIFARYVHLGSLKLFCNPGVSLGLCVYKHRQFRIKDVIFFPLWVQTSDNKERRSGSLNPCKDAACGFHMIHENRDNLH